MSNSQTYEQWLDKSGRDAFESQVAGVVLSLCCGAPMVELLQMCCSNCGTDAETASNKCRHGIDLGTICEMCDYEDADDYMNGEGGVRR